MQPSTSSSAEITEPMHDWAREMWPVCRSITGEGVRTTLSFLRTLLPDLRFHEIPSGTQVFDWIVPDEWNISSAFIEDLSGRRIVDFADNNLHVVGYSEPVDRVVDLEELQKHLHSLPNLPSAIPYVTSYYRRTWGFCLTDLQRSSLEQDQYRIKIESSLRPGVLNYADLILEGRRSEEILLSTYICHPSMANNELSGPVLTVALARWLQSLQNRNYTYRIVFVPETIGSIVYLSRHLDEMRSRTVAGYVITCVGDERAFSYLPTPRGDTLADRAARHTLGQIAPGYRSYSFLDRGSDERQYCAPLVDLPVASIMRSKYATYSEYHTSLDDLTFITQAGLEGSLDVYKRCISLLEKNETYRSTVVGEPQLGRRGLLPQANTPGTNKAMRTMLDIIALADGTRDLIALAEAIHADALEIGPIVEQLTSSGILAAVGVRSVLP